MTNLSKELCEICGIAYTITEDNCRVYDNDGELCEQYVYKLDFEQPKNFVKLLTLPTEIESKNGREIPCKNIWWIINKIAKECRQLAPYYIEAFLMDLIVILRNKNGAYDSELVKQIKQAIREEEWKYE